MTARSVCIVFACLVLFGCGSDKTEESSVEDRRVFSTADFAILLPERWEFLETQSSPDRVNFQSANGDAQLTISIMPFDPNIPQEKLDESFPRLVEIRRQAELDIEPSPELTDFEIVHEDGRSYAKYAGTVLETDQCTATLAIVENHKFVTVFVERQGIDAPALNALASDIFSNFEVK